MSDQEVVQEVPDEAVEAAARRIAEGFTLHDDCFYERPCGRCTTEARHALAAAYPAIRKEIEAEVRAEERERLGAVASQAVAAIDSLFAHLQESGLVEEGGGLPLYEAMKPAAEARAALAAISDIQEAHGG